MGKVVVMFFFSWKLAVNVVAVKTFIEEMGTLNSEKKEFVVV